MHGDGSKEHRGIGLIGPYPGSSHFERLFLHLLTVTTVSDAHVFSALSPRVDHGYFLRDYYPALTPTAVFGYDLAPYPVPS
jgi:hypothetical protein